MKKKMNVGLIGHRFMGKAHSNGLRNVPMFFDCQIEPVMKVICGTSDDLAQIGHQYGWQSFEHSWEKVVNDPAIDIVAIATPGSLHKQIAIEAAKNKKHIICEKPLSNTYEESLEMYEAVKKAGIIHLVNFNYRRVPAVALAKKIVESGRLGQIYHFKGIYQQEWAADPDVPYLWRFDKTVAGAGSMADKGSHILDLARFLVGEISEVASMSDIYVKQRASLENASTPQTVTTDDAAMFITRFQSGAMGLFETSRISMGHKNALCFEINGSKGSLRFNLEKLNELQVYFSHEDKDCQGFKTIMVTEDIHPYIDKWWPAGHIIGWEHTFVHQYYELLKAIATDTLPEPNFYDGLKAQQIIEAVLQAAEEKKWVTL